MALAAAGCAGKTRRASERRHAAPQDHRCRASQGVIRSTPNSQYTVGPRKQLIKYLALQRSPRCLLSILHYLLWPRRQRQDGISRPAPVDHCDGPSAAGNQAVDLTG